MNKLTIAFDARPYYAWQHFINNKKHTLLCCAYEEKAQEAYRQLVFFEGSGSKEKTSILYLPGLDTIPYDRVSPSSDILAQRAFVLTKLAVSDEPRLIVTAAQNLILKVPPPEIFLSSTMEINVGDKLEVKDLVSFLAVNSFSRVSSAVESSEFASRGEIVDVVLTNKGYRINFSWDKVESIRQYDTYSQISLKTVDNLIISPANEIIINEETKNNFKNNFLRLFSVNHINSPLYESIVSGLKFHGYEHLMPLFYTDMALLFDFFSKFDVIYDNLCIKSILEYEHSYRDFYNSRLNSNKANPDSFYFAVPPDKIIAISDKIKEILSQSNCTLVEPGSTDQFSGIDNIAMQAKIENKTEFEKLFDIIVENKKKIPVILFSSQHNIRRMKSIAENYERPTHEINDLLEARKNLLNIGLAPLSGSFISDRYLFISENDIFGNKFHVQERKSSKKKLQNILTELDNIIEGQLIVHKEHGVGKFEKIETIYVDKIAHDCIKLIYANNDILYLPVENIDQLKKFGDEEGVLDKLGSSGWQGRKARLKNRIKDIAAQLIKISAQRQIAKTVAVNFEQSTWEEFCKKFPYNETDDQLSAIEDVRSDLESGRFMDRLICGDVGFGKTEVAMRAAFMVAFDINEDRPQIALISPTTILCKQHYKNFLERFNGLDIRIAQLSRLVKPAEATKIKQDLENGKINIIIGTHSLLAANIKFNNLKMVIIDEEQHFGVVQKEHLKKLKTNIHVISLSATPIPRTLQMSMVGIKDLSLIATPPMDRLPVRANILPYDTVIIRDALMRERFRGGLSFYVVPRIKDIEIVAAQLNKIVPELKFKIAHGQMSPSEIDNVMNEFCEGRFDILLSTTIIESGIDIPIANTMIIHRADMLGLSQLYQLKGRVGRGKVRGYAYLTLTGLKTNKHSLQRLEVLQNIESLGAGFTIASHDMDLRGFGNLIGDEQSGHIKEVGAELYQEMLDDAINELKNNTEERQTEFIPKINLRIPILIPSTYIEDSSLRLAIYRRAGNLASYSEIESFYAEMEDRFGPVPHEFNNLLKMVKLRNKCSELKIESIDSGPNGFVIKFHENFDVSTMVFAFVSKYPRNAKIKPDNKLIFIKTLKDSLLLQEAENILTEINECKH
jgi:transcription-repair coupling factor (superfamily II helicase)